MQVSIIRPQIRCLGFSRALRQRRQGRFVGKNPRALLDPEQQMFGQRLEFEADPAHPLRHQCPVDLDLVARVDRFLAVERKAIGILRHRDLRQQRLRRNAALDDAGAGAVACATPSQPL